MGCGKRVRSSLHILVEIVEWPNSLQNFFSNFSASCKKRMLRDSTCCSNSSCTMAGSSEISNKNRIECLEVRMNVSDHTNGFEGLLMTGEVAERILNCDVSVTVTESFFYYWRKSFCFFLIRKYFHGAVCLCSNSRHEWFYVHNAVQLNVDLNFLCFKKSYESKISFGSCPKKFL